MGHHALLRRSPEGAVHQPHGTLARLFHQNFGPDVPVHADKLAVGNQQAHGLDLVYLHANLRFVGPNPGELPIGGAVLGRDEAVANVHRKHKRVVDILPVRAPENERLKILPHKFMHRLPVAAHHLGRPPVAVKLHILDPPDVGAEVHENAAPQDAAHDAANPVPHIVLRPDPDAVVAVDKRNVLDGIVVALQVEGPGIRMNVGGLLLRIPNAQAADGTGMAHFEQRWRIFLIPSSRGKNDGPLERFAPNGRIHAALQSDPWGNSQAATHQVTARRQ